MTEKDQRLDSESTPADSSKSGPPWLTVETGLYLLLVLLAAALRFSALGRQPLQEQEASLALDAWRFHTGGTAAIRGHSPLLFHGNVLLYLLFEASDHVVRLLPALAGTAMVGLAYMLRPLLGRRSALIAAAFMTFSPSLVFFSRLLNGDIVVAAASLALVAGIFGYARQGNPWQLYVAAAALAISMLAGGATYAILLTLAGFFLVPVLRSRLRKGADASATSQVWFSEKPPPAVALTALGIFAVILLVAATGLLMNLHGLQAVLDLFSGWIGQFRPAADSQPWHYYLALLVVYELPILLFGLAGVCYLTRRDAFFVFLVCWFVVSLVLYSLMGTKSASGILHMLTPLALLAGRAIADLWRQVTEGEGWLWARLAMVISIPAVAHLVIQMAAFGNPEDPGDPRYLVLVLLSLFFLLCVILITGVLSLDWRTSLRSGGLLILVALAALMVHITWRLNYHRPGNAFEALVQKPTSPDMRNLVGAIADFSNQQERQRDSVLITVAGEEDPLAGWYLRDFANVAFVSGAVLSPTPVVITGSEDDPALPDYRGARFRVQTSWQGSGLPGHDLINWFLFRESLTRPEHRDVVMWVAPESGER